MKAVYVPTEFQAEAILSVWLIEPVSMYLLTKFKAPLYAALDQDVY